MLERVWEECGRVCGHCGYSVDIFRRECGESVGGVCEECGYIVGILCRGCDESLERCYIKVGNMVEQVWVVCVDRVWKQCGESLERVWNYVGYCGETVERVWR